MMAAYTRQCTGRVQGSGFGHFVSPTGSRNDSACLGATTRMPRSTQRRAGTEMLELLLDHLLDFDLLFQVFLAFVGLLAARETVRSVVEVWL